jgi:hypothetical protein
MTRRSSFYDPTKARALTGIPPRLQFNGLTGGYVYVTSTRAEDGKFLTKHQTVQFGSMLVLDFGGAERGWLQFRPYDDSHLAPMHHPVPAQPEGDYAFVARIPVFLQTFALAQWTLGGIIAQERVFGVYRVFQSAREASEGRLPVCRLQPSQQIAIASRNGELHPAPVLEIVGWVERDEGKFGPRIVPPPLPLLSAAAAAAPLPRPLPPETAAAAAPLPVSETAAAPPQPAIASPTVPAAANDDAGSTVAANDDGLFAGMTPIAERPPF